MSLLSRLFGGGSKPEPQPELYKDVRIFPEPIKEGAEYRLAARLEKDFGDTVKTHQLIRADCFSSLEKAQEGALLKARQVIDQQGDRIF